MIAQPQTRLCTDFQYPDFIFEFIVDFNRYWVDRMKDEGQPFGPLRELSNVDSKQGRPFWNALREFYVEADSSGRLNSVEEWEVAVICSNHNVDYMRRSNNI